MQGDGCGAETARSDIQRYTELMTQGYLLNTQQCIPTLSRRSEAFSLEIELYKRSSGTQRYQAGGTAKAE